MGTTPPTTATGTPGAGSPGPKTNRIGLSVLDYRGGKTTLCAGCGHNAISERIIDAFFEMGIEPENVAKVSGIGCSSKSPAYFMGRSHSFNAVHGRMPAIATGAAVANHKLMYIGVSGDGDTASIGMGQFAHLMRRNIPMIYIIENNGVYGLTKGQFSATADLGSTLKSGKVNDLPGIDPSGSGVEIEMHDGSKLHLTKLEEDFDPTNRTVSLTRLAEAREHNETLTGLFYLAENQPSFTDLLRIVEQPLGTLPLEMTRPPKSVLDEIMAEYR